MEDLKFNKANQSNIKLDIQLIDEEYDVEVNELQRTKKWREDRRGRWTGTQFKTLLSCSSKGGKLPWNEKAKVFMFSDGALKSIYENAMERKTGRYIDSGEGTKQMKFGTKVEPLISKAAEIQLAAIGMLEDVGFKRFPGMPEAGVSSDKILRDLEPKKNGKILATVEMKACTTWQTHFNRTFELMDDKSLDFWQTQGQMIAWGVDLCYYIVSQPPTNIDKYLYYQGDIMDLYDDFCKECPISIQEVKASEIHQEALLLRIRIAEETINEWLNVIDGDLRSILYKIIDKHKNSQEDSIPENDYLEKVAEKVEPKECPLCGEFFFIKRCNGCGFEKKKKKKKNKKKNKNKNKKNKK